MASQDVAHIEGPYWDYAALDDYATQWRSTHACNAARYLVEDDLFMARACAAEFAVFDALLWRLSDRYSATQSDDVRWIGWH